MQYLRYENIEKKVNSESFTQYQIPGILSELQSLMTKNAEIDKRFLVLNKNFYHLAELEGENQLRSVKPRLLYERLSKE